MVTLTLGGIPTFWVSTSSASPAMRSVSSAPPLAWTRSTKSVGAELQQVLLAPRSAAAEASRGGNEQLGVDLVGDVRRLLNEAPWSATASRSDGGHLEGERILGRGAVGEDRRCRSPARRR